MTIPSVPGSLFGKDVSHWQTTSDWAPGDGPGLRFLIARATVGTKPDDKYAAHIAKARNAGLVTGAYHFNYDAISVSDQVDAFLRAAGTVDMYALDVEGDNAFSLAQTKAFITRFKNLTDKKIGLYMSSSGFFLDAGQDWNWIALWGTNTPPSKPWDIWQFGPEGGEDGDLVKSASTLARIQATDIEGEPLSTAAITNETPALTDVLVGDKLFDLDGTTLLTTSTVETLGRPSPFGVGTKRAVYATISGVRRLALVNGRNVRDVPAAVDTTPFSQADLDASTSDAVARANDAEAARLIAVQQAADATTAERERIAQAEAARIRLI